MMEGIALAVATLFLLGRHLYKRTVERRATRLARPQQLKTVFCGKRYDTDRATLLARGPSFLLRGEDWDRSFEDGQLHVRIMPFSGGKADNTFLFLARNGGYFVVRHFWTRRKLQLILVPLSEKEAVGVWEDVFGRIVAFEDAFPGVGIQEA